MSSRRKEGELVRTHAGTLGRIATDGWEECWLARCGDPDCKEWATLHDPNDPSKIVACHVSECQMVPPTCG